MALRSRFYNRLTDKLKDKLTDYDKPETFTDLRNLFIRLQNRIRERKIEKKNNYFYLNQKNLYTIYSNKKTKKKEQAKKRKRLFCYNSNGYNSIGRDIDGKPKREQKEGGLLLKREENYNNYRKPGHQAREYRLPKKKVRTIEKEKKLIEKQPKKEKKIFYIAKRIRTLN